MTKKLKTLVGSNIGVLKNIKKEKEKKSRHLSEISLLYIWAVKESWAFPT